MTERAALTNIPRHVAIIMDGNGRWAKARGLPRLAGHRAGTENIRRILEGCVEFGIPYLTLYAFSTENWERPEPEVRGLMHLLEEVLERELQALHAQGVKIRHLGWYDHLSENLCRMIQNALALTHNNTRITLNVAFNYGGRSEILRAIQAMLRDGIRAEEVNEAVFTRYLCTAGLPDPDLIIRTGGEMRLSNFLIWQAAYAEYYSTPTFWPDFGKDELYRALQAYSQRERRFGKLPEAVVNSQ